jgi:glucose/arabinose dehydrogenase/cytochrome c2
MSVAVGAQYGASALSAANLPFAICAIAMPAIVAGAVTAALNRRDSLPASTALGLMLAVIAPLLLGVLLSGIDYSRVILVASAAVTFGGVAFGLYANRSLNWFAIVAVACAIAAAGTASTLRKRHRTAPLVASYMQPQHQIISDLHYDIVATYYPAVTNQSDITGGGIATFGDRYLAAVGDGSLYLLWWAPNHQKIESRPLALRVPMNREAFLRTLPNGGAGVEHLFRTTDLLVREDDGRVTLFAAHHHWDDAGQCATLRVSVAEGDAAAFADSPSPLPWRTLFDSKPCMPLKNTSHYGHLFAGHQSGGRLAMLDSRTLLLSVGDHEFDGVNGPSMPQDPNSSLGKIIAIDLASGQSSVFSSGHRNPEGLFVAPGNIVWETEHGPRGGDELNRVERGRNYGWPLVTYGGSYDGGPWPPSTGTINHGSFREPVHAWVPSIGVSDVIEVRGRLFRQWRGDLLAASLNGESLYRLHLVDGRPVFQMQMNLGHRVRDVLEDREGRLILWTETFPLAPGTAGVIVLEPVRSADGDTSSVIDSALAGQVAAQSRCAGCHNLGNSGAQIGPPLRGVVGRRIAPMNGFSYSEALKAANGIWTAERLDGFLADPRTAFPGTLMQIDGIKDAAERRAIIGYLQSLH